MAERVDLDAAQRKAESLKRYAEANGLENLADFAAVTRVLVAELHVARAELAAVQPLVHIARQYPYLQDLAAALRAYDRHASPSTPDPGEATP